jgi:glucose-6-phosphate 1-epimerase
VDRIYTGVDHDLVIDDPVFGRRIRIAAEGSASAVVWNPWAATAAAMALNQANNRQVATETHGKH